MLRKSLKKAVALVLAIVMMIPSTGISAGAAANTEDSVIDLLGKSIYTYAASGGNDVDKMFDGDDGTLAKVARNDNKRYLAYVVFNGSDFGNQVDKIRFYSKSGNKNIIIFGTNDSIVLDAENFTNHDQDYKSFKEESTHLFSPRGGEDIQEVTEENKDFSKHNYIVISFEAWTTTDVNELTFYKTMPKGPLELTDVTVEEEKISYAISNEISEPTDIYVALYDDSGTLVSVNKGESGTFDGVEMQEEYRLNAFAWEQNTMIPICEKLEKTIRAEQTMEAYLFVHFVGTEKNPEDEQVYFSVSEDAHYWEAVNDGKPVLMSTMGEKGIRDMHIIRSAEGDKFYLIGTDLSMYYNHKTSDGSANWSHASTYGSKYINIWESEDLIHWSDQRQVLVAPSDAGNTWAPESIYDKDKKSYMVFWASTTTVDGARRQRIYAAYTKDYKTFTGPEIYQDLPGGVIDTTIYYDGDKYYRFYKTGRDVYGEYADSLHADNWTSTGLKISNHEGPEVFKFNNEDRWGLLVDSENYSLYTTSNLGASAFRKEEMTTETTYRHGTVIPITKKEYEALKSMGSQEEKS